MAYNASERHGHLRTRMRAVNGQEITYRRADQTRDCDATVYELSPADLLAYGVALSVRRRDYVIDVAELEAAGLKEPLAGDQISDGTLVCQVAPLVHDEPPFRYTTQRRDAVRIHTIVISK